MKKIFLCLLIILFIYLAFLFYPKKIIKKRKINIFCIDISASISLKEREIFKNKILKLIKNNKNKKIFIFFGKSIKKFNKFNLTYYFNRKDKSSKSLNLALYLAFNIIKREKSKGKIYIFTDGSNIKIDKKIINLLYNNKIKVIIFYPPLRKDIILLKIHTPLSLFYDEPIYFKIWYKSNFSGYINIKILKDNKIYLEKKNIKVKKGIANLIIEGKPINKKGNIKFKVIIYGDKRAENNIGFCNIRLKEHIKLLLITQNLTNISIFNSMLDILKLDKKIIKWEDIQKISFKKFQKYNIFILDSPNFYNLKRINKKIIKLLKKGKHIIIANLKTHKTLKYLPILPLPFSKKKDNLRKKKRERKNPKQNIKLEKFKVELKTAALIFIIDKSGSMEQGGKLEIAKLSTLECIKRLWQEDQVGVIAFDIKAYWIVPLIKGGDIKWIAQRLSNIKPFGGTSIIPPLEKAYESLKNTNAHIKHIILLSDGYDTQNGLFLRNKILPLLENIEKDKITVTTIGIGKDFDPILMPWIAKKCNGNFYFASDYREIPVVMLKDMDRILKIRKLSQKKIKKDINLPKLKLKIPKKKKFKEEKYQKTIIKGYKVYNIGFKILKTWKNNKNLPKFPLIKKFQKYKIKKRGFIELIIEKKYPLLCYWDYLLGKLILWNTSLDTWKEWKYYPYLWENILKFGYKLENIDIKIEKIQIEDKKLYIFFKILNLPYNIKMLKIKLNDSKKEIFQLDTYNYLLITRYKGVKKVHLIPIEIWSENRLIYKDNIEIIIPYSDEFKDLNINKNIFPQNIFFNKYILNNLKLEKKINEKKVSSKEHFLFLNNIINNLLSKNIINILLLISLFLSFTYLIIILKNK